MTKKTSPLRSLATPGRKLATPGRALRVEPSTVTNPFGHIYNDQRWKRLSASMRKAGKCAVCGVGETEVDYLVADHITELKDGGAAFDPANIQILCPAHHQQKTKAARIERGWAPMRSKLLAMLDDDAPIKESTK